MTYFHLKSLHSMTSNVEQGAPERRTDEVDDFTEEPNLRGTIFLTLLLLMLIFGFWVMMYLTMIRR